jgi:hypothetical protein
MKHLLEDKMYRNEGAWKVSILINVVEYLSLLVELQLWIKNYKSRYS